MKGFELDMELPVEEGFRDVIGRSIHYMKDQIHTSEDIHHSIHECRRTCKRIRAVLKMIRDEIGYSNYFRENRFYRDLSRRMSGPRDDFVLLQSVDELELKKPVVFRKELLSPLKELLSDRMEKRIVEFTIERGGFGQVLKDLEDAEVRVTKYCRLRDSFSAMKSGIRRVYRKGYRFGTTDRISESVEAFHEYRKQTKYLLYQMELISPVFPNVMNAYTGTLDKHAEILGDTRDIDRLELFLEELPEGLIRPKALEELMELIRLKRRKKLKKIHRNSPLIFAEKPKQFVRRLESYWEIRHQNN